MRHIENFMAEQYGGWNLEPPNLTYALQRHWTQHLMLKGPRQTYSIMYVKNNEFCGYAQLMTMRLAVTCKCNTGQQRIV